jgi:acyl-CoA thioesterase FadM
VAVNLFVRLFKVLLLGLLRPARIDALGESILHFRVWPNDLDTNLHMNNGRYMTLLDLGRFDLLMRVGIFKIGLRKRWNPVLGAATVRFRRSLKLWDRFTLKTRLIGWDTTWIYLEQTIEADSKLVTLAYLRGVFTGPQGKVPIPELIAAMGMQNRESPQLPAGVKQWLDAEESLYAEVMRGRSSS